MTICTNSSPRKRKICTGDLKNLITIQTRTLTSNGFEDVDYDEVFTQVIQVWAAIKTTRGFQSFNDVGTIQNNITHKIYIRFSADFTITSEDWLDFEGERYLIRDIENLEERNEYLLLYCVKKGDNTKLANKS